MIVLELRPSRLVFELGRLPGPVGVFASEAGFEPVEPRSFAPVRLAGLLERLAALTLRVGRPRRARLRQLPLANIGDPVALVGELVARVGNRLTPVGGLVSLVRATRPKFERAAQPLDAGGIRRDPVRLTVSG